MRFSPRPLVPQYRRGICLFCRPHQSVVVLWYTLKYSAALCFAIYHRKVYQLDIDKLPDEGPVLLTLNHPGAFLDACLISAYSKRPLYYLTRGDFFKPGIANWFLTQTHQIPIYRAEHGMKQMRANRDTFEKCYDKLAEGGVVIIFPESVAAVEKKLRPLHKGAARIVFGTYDNHGIMPTLIPAGFTFSDPRYFGYDAFVKYGDPIPAEDYLETYREDPKRAIIQLTEAIAEGMTNTMICLDDSERESLFDEAVMLLEERPPKFPPLSDSQQMFAWQSGLARSVNQLSGEQLAELNETRKKVRNDLNKAKIRFDRAAQLEDRDFPLPILLLVEPVALLGDLLIAVPTWFTKRFILSKVRRDPFIGPLKSMLGYFVYLIFFVLLGGIAAIFIGAKGWALAFVGLMVAYFRLMRNRAPRLWHWFRWRSREASDKERFASFRKDLRNGLLD